MKQQTDLTTMLALIPQPAFYVCGGQILLCNKAATDLNIHPDTCISQLIGPEDTEYQDFHGGCLYLTLYHDGLPLEASVSPMGEGNVFVIEESSSQPELKAYALASFHLRQPLSSVITLIRQLDSTLQRSEEPKAQERTAELKHQLWRMHRMLCNMSDAKFYTESIHDRRICQNASGVVEEIFRKIQETLHPCGIQLSYLVPYEDISCMLDEQLLERAIYNMVSNAVKFADSNTKLNADLKRKGNRLHLSITEHSSSVNAKYQSNIFQQYTREPGIETGPTGIGLGMSLVRSAARVHNGTVLLDHPSANETRITLSFPIDPGRDAKVASGIANMDYAGGWDHGLLELSDILPADFYSKT